jgi:hypothetical protein
MQQASVVDTTVGEKFDSVWLQLNSAVIYYHFFYLCYLFLNDGLGALVLSAHVVSQPSILEDHSQVEDSPNWCNALGQVNDLSRLRRVSNIQRANHHLHRAAGAESGRYAW